MNINLSYPNTFYSLSNLYPNTQYVIIATPYNQLNVANVNPTSNIFRTRANIDNAYFSDITSSNTRLNWQSYYSYNTLDAKLYTSVGLVNTQTFNDSLNNNLYQNLNPNTYYYSLLTPYNYTNGLSQPGVTYRTDALTLATVSPISIDNYTSTTAAFSWNYTTGTSFDYNQLIIKDTTPQSNVILNTTLSGLNYNITNLTPNTGYIFSLTPFNTCNIANLNQTQYAYINELGSIGVVSVATLGISNVTLSWSAGLYASVIAEVSNVATNSLVTRQTNITNTLYTTNVLSSNVLYSSRIIPVNNAGVPNYTDAYSLQFTTLPVLNPFSLVSTDSNITINSTYGVYSSLIVNSNSVYYKTITSLPHIINNLPPNSYYSINIIPVNSAGLFGVSQTASIYTWATVGTISFTEINTNSIKVVTNGLYNNIKIQWSPSNSNVGLTSASNTINGLSANTPYNFTITPYNPSGVSGTVKISNSVYTLGSINTFTVNTLYTNAFKLYIDGIFNNYNLIIDNKSYYGTSNYYLLPNVLSENSTYNISIIPINVYGLSNTSITPITNTTLSTITNIQFVPDQYSQLVSWINSPGINYANIEVLSYIIPTLIAPSITVKNTGDSSVTFDAPIVTNIDSIGTVTWSMNNVNTYTTSMSFVDGSPLSTISMDSSGVITVPKSCVFDKIVYIWATNIYGGLDNAGDINYRLTTVSFATPVLVAPTTSPQNTGDGDVIFSAPTIMNASAAGALTWSINNTNTYVTGNTFTGGSPSSTITINSNGQIVVPRYCNINTTVYVWGTNPFGLSNGVSYNITTIGYAAPILIAPSVATQNTGDSATTFIAPTISNPLSCGPVTWSLSSTNVYTTGLSFNGGTPSSAISINSGSGVITIPKGCVFSGTVYVWATNSLNSYTGISYNLTTVSYATPVLVAPSVATQNTGDSQVTFSAPTVSNTGTGTITWSINSVDSFVTAVSFSGGTPASTISINSGSGVITIPRYCVFNATVYVWAKNPFGTYSKVSYNLTTISNATPILVAPSLVTQNTGDAAVTFSAPTVSNSAYTGTVTWSISSTNTYTTAVSFSGGTPSSVISINSGTGVITIPKSCVFNSLVYVWATNPVGLYNTVLSYTITTVSYATPVLVAPSVSTQNTGDAAVTFAAPTVSNSAQTGTVTWSINSVDSFVTAVSFSGGTPASTISIDSVSGIITIPRYCVFNATVYVWAKNLFGTYTKISYILTTISNATPVLVAPSLVTQNTGDAAVTFAAPTVSNSAYTGALTWSINSVNTYTTAVSFNGGTPSSVISINSGTGVITVPQGCVFNSPVYVWATNPVGLYNTVLSYTLTTVSYATPVLIAPSVATQNTGDSLATFAAPTVSNSVQSGSVTWSINSVNSFVTATSFTGGTPLSTIAINSGTGVITVPQGCVFSGTVYVWAKNLFGVYTGISYTITTVSYATPVLVAPTVTTQNAGNSSVTFAAPTVSNSAYTGSVTWSINSVDTFVTGTSFSGGTPASTISINSGSGVITIPQYCVFSGTVYVWAKNLFGTYTKVSYNLTTVSYTTPVLSAPNVTIQNVYNGDVLFPAPTVTNNSLTGTVTWSINSVNTYTTAVSFSGGTPLSTISINPASGVVTIPQYCVFSGTVYVWATNPMLGAANSGTISYTLNTLSVPPPILSAPSLTLQNTYQGSASFAAPTVTNSAQTGYVTWSINSVNTYTAATSFIGGTPSSQITINANTGVVSIPQYCEYNTVVYVWATNGFGGSINAGVISYTINTRSYAPPTLSPPTVSTINVGDSPGTFTAPTVTNLVAAGGSVTWSMSNYTGYTSGLSFNGGSPLSSIYINGTSGIVTVPKSCVYNAPIYVWAANSFGGAINAGFTNYTITTVSFATPVLSAPTFGALSTSTSIATVPTPTVTNAAAVNGAVTWSINSVNTYTTGTSFTGGTGGTPTNTISINSTTGVITINKYCTYSGTVYVWATGPSPWNLYGLVSYVVTTTAYTVPALTAPTLTTQNTYYSLATFAAPTVTNSATSGTLTWSINSVNTYVTATSFSGGTPLSSISIDSSGVITVPLGCTFNARVYVWATNPVGGSANAGGTNYIIPALSVAVPSLTAPSITSQNIYYTSATYAAPTVTNSSAAGTVTWSINTVNTYTTATTFVDGIIISIDVNSGIVTVPQSTTAYNKTIYVWATNAVGGSANAGSVSYNIVSTSYAIPSLTAPTLTTQNAGNNAVTYSAPTVTNSAFTGAVKWSINSVNTYTTGLSFSGGTPSSSISIDQTSGIITIPQGCAFSGTVYVWATNLTGGVGNYGSVSYTVTSVSYATPVLTAPTLTTQYTANNSVTYSAPTVTNSSLTGTITWSISNTNTYTTGVSFSGGTPSSSISIDPASGTITIPKGCAFNSTVYVWATTLWTGSGNNGSVSYTVTSALYAPPVLTAPTLTTQNAGNGSVTYSAPTVTNSALSGAVKWSINSVNTYTTVLSFSGGTPSSSISIDQTSGIITIPQGCAFSGTVYVWATNLTGGVGNYGSVSYTVTSVSYATPVLTAPTLTTQYTANNSVTYSAPTVTNSSLTGTITWSISNTNTYTTGVSFSGGTPSSSISIDPASGIITIPKGCVFSGTVYVWATTLWTGSGNYATVSYTITSALYAPPVLTAPTLTTQNAGNGSVTYSAPTVTNSALSGTVKWSINSVNTYTTVLSFSGGTPSSSISIDQTSGIITIPQGCAFSGTVYVWATNLTGGVGNYGSVSYTVTSVSYATPVLTAPTLTTQYTANNSVTYSAPTVTNSSLTGTITWSISNTNTYTTGVSFSGGTPSSSISIDPASGTITIPKGCAFNSTVYVWATTLWTGSGNYAIVSYTVTSALYAPPVLTAPTLTTQNAGNGSVTYSAPTVTNSALSGTVKWSINSVNTYTTVLSFSGGTPSSSISIDQTSGIITIPQGCAFSGTVYVWATNLTGGVGNYGSVSYTVTSVSYATPVLTAPTLTTQYTANNSVTYSAPTVTNSSLTGTITWSISNTNTYTTGVSFSGGTPSSSISIDPVYGIITIPQGCAFSGTVYVWATTLWTGSSNYTLVTYTVTSALYAPPVLTAPLSVVIYTGINDATYTAPTITNSALTGAVKWSINLVNTYVTTTSFSGGIPASSISINSGTGVITIPQGCTFSGTVYVWATNLTGGVGNYGTVSYTVTSVLYPAPVLVAPTLTTQNTGNSSAYYSAPTVTNSALTGTVKWSINSVNTYVTTTSFTGGTPSSNISINSGTGVITVPQGCAFNATVYVWATNPTGGAGNYGLMSYNITSVSYATPFLTAPNTTKQDASNNLVTFAAPTVTNSSLTGTIKWSINNTNTYTTGVSFSGGTPSSSISIDQVSGIITIPQGCEFSGTVYVWATTLWTGSGNYATVSYIISSFVILYNFTSFTFTNAGSIGANGPSLVTLRSNADYSSQSWTQDTVKNYLNMTIQGIQLWKVPRTGNYQIIVAGAAGGNAAISGGSGIIVYGTYLLTVNTVIQILVGQQGLPNMEKRAAGGGGTYVVTSANTGILIAGGGGGGAQSCGGLNGTTSTSGLTGNGASVAVGSGAGGTNGGGGGGGQYGGGGGGGLTGNGGNATSTSNNAKGGLSFTSNGTGGAGSGDGGFGGGGGASLQSWGGGGAGGYSGGGGGLTGLNGNGGGGGGSYDVNNSAGSYVASQYLQSITANGGTYTNGYCSGDGFVQITFIS